MNGRGLSGIPTLCSDDLSRPVAVFIVSRNSTTTHRRTLWIMSQRDAMKVCSDERTGIGAHPNHMLCWTAEDIDDPKITKFVRDKGTYDDVLKDHNVRILKP